jgi:hypothetical protein
MTAAPLFEAFVRVRIHAPASRFDGHEGTVDAHELRAAQASHARKHLPALTVHFDDDRSTIAFADEIEVLASTPLGGSTDNGNSRSTEGQR